MGFSTLSVGNVRKMAIPPLLPIEMNFLKAYIHPLAMKGEFKMTQTVYRVLLEVMKSR